MGSPIYMEALKKDKKRYEKFLHYQELGLITEFDGETLTRLRNIYWGQFYEAVLYMYYEETNFETIGNKVELLCEALANQEYRIGHALTKTASSIPYALLNHKHLDYNSFVEKINGQNSWVYDVFALLKFDRKVFDEIEEPRSRMEEMTTDEIMTCIDFVGKSDLTQIRRVLEVDDRYDFNLPYMFIRVIDDMEKRLANHPYKELIEREISILKEKHNFKELKREVANEMRLNGFTDSFK